MVTNEDVIRWALEGVLMSDEDRATVLEGVPAGATAEPPQAMPRE